MNDRESGRLARLESAFDRALDLDDGERSRYLEELASSDPELAAELELLLEANDRPDERLPRDPAATTWDELEDSVERDLPNASVGGFRLLAKLGEGGMATVYRAVRETDEFRQEVAIKVLRSTLQSEDSRLRFARERRIVAGFDHPNIARLIDGGVTPGGRPYFALELVDGRPVDRYAQEERLTIEQRVRLIIEVGRALDYAHRNLVVHRDLKPSNVFVNSRGHVRLLDFGIAKEIGTDDSVTFAGGSPMTPVYASPEQIAGETMTTASDQYQLGLLLFELVTGRRHHLLDGDDPTSILRRVTELETPRPSRVLAEVADAERALDWRATPRELISRVRGDLDWIVLKALARDPERRYSSVSALVEDLERYLAGEPLRARPPSSGYRLRKWVGRNRALSVLAGLLVLVVCASIWVAREQRQRAQRIRQFSQRVERETEQIERILRDAALQPLHDTSRERALVGERMARIAAQAEGSESLLGPAANYGVGRGHLALGDPERAAELLTAAWDGGFRGEGIRWALGVAYGELYRKELATARGIRDLGLRRERIERAESLYRDRALVQLRAIEPELEERAEEPTALIAFYEGRLDEALEIVERVRGNFPWARWALAMEAEILNERAQQRYLAGALEEADLDLRRAGEVLRAGLEIGRSDADLYLQECRRLDAVVRVSTWSERDSLEPLIENAEEACGRAALIRPDWVEPHLSLASFYLAAWDSGRYWQGGAATITVPMRATVERALAVEPEHTEVQHRLGIVEYFEGFSGLLVGEDPRERLARATEAFERAIALDPSYPFNYNGLALVASTLSGWQIRHGIDPTETILRGRSQAARAVEMLPSWHNARTNLARNHIREGHWLSLIGSDPTSAYTRALEAVRPVIEANPTFPGALRIVGQANYGLGVDRVDSGLDPRPAARAALASFRQTLEERAYDGVAWIGLAGALLLEMWNGVEPPDDASMGEALEAVRRAREAFEVSVHVSALELELASLGLKRAPTRRGTPAPRQRVEALVASTAALELPSAFLDGTLAAGCRVLAAERLERGSSPLLEARRGLEFADRSLSINPLLWSAAIERLALRLAVAAGERAERERELELLRAEATEILERRPQSRALIEPLLEWAAGLEGGALSGRDAGSRLRRYLGPFPFRR